MNSDGQAQATGSPKTQDSTPYRVRIAQMAPSDRPRERLAERGAENLSNPELIAIILRTGTSRGSALDLADELLSRFGGLMGLAQSDTLALQEVSGIGAAKAAELRAALEIGHRLVLARAGNDEKPRIGSSADAAALIGPPLRLLEQESLRVVLLDTRHRVLGVETVATGSLNVVSARVGDIFRAAVRRNCAALVLAHNHPSGDTEPSTDDINLTRRAIEGGKLLGINVLDHLVIGSSGEGYASIREVSDLW